MSVRSGASRGGTALLAQPAQQQGYGSLGRPQKVFVNLVEFTKFPEADIYQYNVVVVPERGDFKRLPPPAYMRSVFDAAMGAHRQGKLKGTTMVYDSRKIAYAPKRVCGPKETLELDVAYNEDGRTENYVIKLREAAVVNTSIISEFIRGRGNVDVGDIQSALNALDLAIGSVLHLEMVGFNRSFFTREQSRAISGGLELWRGFSFSVRPGIDRLYLNVNTAVTAMYTPGSLLDALMSLLDMRDPSQLRGRMTPQTVREMGSYLRGLILHNEHRGIQGKRKFSVRGVTSRPLDQESFEWEDPDHPGPPATITVAQYFQRRYNLHLRYPFLPGLVGRKNSVFPIEFCEIAQNQRFRGKLDDRQTADMVKFACQRPGDNMNRICDVLRQVDLGRSPVVQSFGLALPTRLSEVESRIMPAPTVNYGRGSRDASFVPQGGVWNMRDKHVSVAGQELKYWAVLVLASKQYVHEGSVQSFVTMLVSTCGNTGYRVGNPRPPIVYGNPNSDIAREVTRARDSIRAPSGVAPQLLLVILPSTNIQVYQTVKNCAYTTLGIHTQCMQAKHVQRPNMQYCANLCLKINAKLGGSNQALPSAHMEQLLRRKPTLFLGCDVTHPAPGEQHKPSIASVVGSVDFVGLRYVATLIQLPSRQEMVDKLQEAIVRHLKLFFKGTKTKPQRIVFYRDGVSETQFAQVRDREIIEIQRACASVENGYKPEITFLAVLKRHNTRFFPMGRDGDRTGNCVPGTVIDRAVTMPGMTDFYLFAHAAIQGTSRPTHYYVLHDDANFTADAIQQLTYHLCYTYAICTRSVSLVPPVYYAHRVADRARCHLVDMGVGFEEASSESNGYYGGAGVSAGRQAAPGRAAASVAKIIKISSHLDESMYFM
ncbi:hypothetical protein GGI04_000199 [Coemansia thaxteri]|nr:hypothetical protein GGI04_000199 [Coemansia thaxteri]KAJ2474224.1 hypothetical protein GGI02_000269 [Coemansia sp. RSA 2322]KAJ2486321.1 hypothetical protein EV174_001192 [Coemansia sp. RSA 2320]